MQSWWDQFPEPDPPEPNAGLHPRSAFPWVWRPLERFFFSEAVQKDLDLMTKESIERAFKEGEWARAELREAMRRTTNVSSAEMQRRLR